MSTSLHFLVATDFSPRAYHAFRYAVRLARYFKAHVTLLHAYHIPIVASSNEIAIQEGMHESIERDAQTKLNEWLQEVVEEEVPCEVVNEMGFAVDTIKKFTQTYPVDLLIMGARGGGDMDRLLGSTSTAMMRQTEIPMLLVPEESDFKGLYNIAFASDYKQIEENESTQLLKQIASKFNSEVHILAVKKKEEDLSNQKVQMTRQLEGFFQNIRHAFYIEENEQVEDGIQAFVNNNNIDLLVMQPHKQNFWERLFIKSITKRMTFKTEVPIFILQESK
ncbi:MAG: universal stress protein [Thermonemataceae bacterium]